MTRPVTPVPGVIKTGCTPKRFPGETKPRESVNSLDVEYQIVKEELGRRKEKESVHGEAYLGNLRIEVSPQTKQLLSVCVRGKKF